MAKGWQTHLQEEEKYKKMWSVDEYRRNSPGEHLVDKFLNYIPLGEDCDTFVADFGCGTGRAMKKMAQQAGVSVFGFDIADNCLDEDCKHLPVQVMNLWHEMPARHLMVYDAAFCTDVMEHIPPSFVDDVLSNIKQSLVLNGIVFFQIALDKCTVGRRHGEDLHLSIKSQEEWLSTLNKYFRQIETTMNNGRLIYVGLSGPA